MKRIILLLFFTILIDASSQDTNNIFLPEDLTSQIPTVTLASENPHLPKVIIEANKIFNAQRSNEVKSNAILYAQLRQAAIKSRECLPAELDPNGHWGPITSGFQLSIRSSTNVFVVGKPIPVAVILRNTTTNVLSRLDMSGNEASFCIVDESGHVRRTVYPGSSGIRFVSLAARRQVKHEYDLKEKFHLPIGGYSVQVSQIVMFKQLDKEIVTNVYSGTLAIKVLAN